MKRPVNNLSVGIRGLWNDIQSSLWFRPGLIALLAILLAIVAPYVDQNTTLKFYAIGADNARAVLTTIAGSMLSVVTLTFSILMVALTLTSQQFSPRVLRSFTSDRTAQNILGVLIGAFLYSLLVLVTVINTSNTTFVPLLSILIAIGFALVGIAAFIYFIDHIAKSIRVSYIIHTINHDTVALLHSRLPEQVVGHGESTPLTDPVMNKRAAARVDAQTAGYIQAIDTEQLATVAEKHGYTIQIVGMTGDFVAQGRPLLYVWEQTGPVVENDGDEPEQAQETDGTAPAEDQPRLAISEHLDNTLRQQFDIGVERTMYEDVLFGIRQLVDIALKALSPGVNDPTTATNCIHYLTNILIQATCRPDQQISHYDKQGNLCLIGRTVSFAAMLTLAFDELRHYGCADPTVAVQLLDALVTIADETPEQERRNLLWAQATLIAQRADSSVQQKYDRSRVNQRLLHLADLLAQDYAAVALQTLEDTSA